MSQELSKINKLASLDEFHFLLTEALNDTQAIQKEDLSSLCIRKSVNLRFAFENTLLFLSVLSIVDFQPDGSISKNKNINWETIHVPEELAVLILLRIFNYLEDSGQLKLVFGEGIMIPEQQGDLTVLYSNKIPLHFSCIRIFLLNTRIAIIDQNSPNRLIVCKEYTNYFKPLLTKPKTLNSIEQLPLPENKTDKTRPPGGYNVFISYSYADESHKDALKKHLKSTMDNGEIKVWEGRAILPGEDWDNEIKKKLDEANVILFLVSSDFMNSDYIKEVEIKYAIERYERNEVKIVPVIVRPCDFDSLPLSKHMAVPTGKKAISTWSNSDEAYLDVVKHIKRMLGLI
jgi:hypothetical protein